MKQELTCKLTTPELQKRRTTVIRELKDLVIHREEITEGYEYFFQSDDAILDKINSFIESERLCCDFFSFRLSINGANAVLEITGPEGVKEFIDHEIGF